MTIERADILKLAELARIAITDSHIEETAKRLDNVLDLVDQLQSADTSNVAPMAHPLNAVQRLRKDEVTETDRHQEFQTIAPAVEDGLYLVPKVID